MSKEHCTSPHHVRRQLLRSKEAYVESVGKTDMAALGKAADAPGGKGTVVRLIMGATENMPARAMTYVDSALRIARIIGCEQLQIIHANNLGSSVNPIDLAKARQQAELLALVAKTHIKRTAPDQESSVLHAEDKPVDLADFLPLSRIAIKSSPATDSLLAKGAKHGGNPEVYAAAHCLFQDTDRLELHGLVSDQPVQAKAERIISIGCQQERLFYGIRMAMRQLCAPSELIDTAQVFTKHFTPPYFTARDGEQSLESVLVSGLDLSLNPDLTARRDLQHFLNITEGVTND